MIKHKISLTRKPRLLPFVRNPRYRRGADNRPYLRLGIPMGSKVHRLKQSFTKGAVKAAHKLIKKQILERKMARQGVLLNNNPSEMFSQYLPNPLRPR